MEINMPVRPGRNLHITIHENPDSDTTAFLIHGLGGRGEQWREQINVLRKHYTLVIPDLLGHGKSEKPYAKHNNNPYIFSELEQDLQSLFNHYSTENNIILGHSYGGALAIPLIMDHQDRIHRFILLSPTPCMPNHSIPFFYHLPLFVMECFRPFIDQKFLRLAFGQHANSELISTEKKANQANLMRVIKLMVNGMQKTPVIDTGMITTPGLIIIGEQDGLISPDAQKNFYQSLPKHEFVIIPEASHMALLEKPELVNKKIIKFLN